MESSSVEEKSEKKKVDYSGLGYCCCVILVTLIVLSIIYWYITIPIIGVLIIVYLIFRYNNKKKIYITLDTKIKQEEFITETGYLPIENGKFTEKYKVWLIQKENERKGLLQLQPTLQPQISYQVAPTYQPVPRREMEKNTLIRELHTLKSNILEIPQKYPTSNYSFGAGVVQAKDQVPIICSNIDDAINALKIGKDSQNRPITAYQIADGLNKLINATRHPEFIGLITSVLNNDGINELVKKLNELEQIAEKIREIRREPISPTQTIVQPQSISRPQSRPQRQSITPPQPISRPQQTPTPVYSQEKEIEDLIQVDTKDLKIKFRDYNSNEKIIRVITELLAITLFIFFSIFIIWSVMNKLYANIIISAIIMGIYIIPHEIIEKRLLNRARIRKQKAMVAKYLKLKEVPSRPSYQTQPVYQPEPVYHPEPVYQPVPRQETEKIICQYCGSENLKNNKYCDNCGSNLN